MATLIRKAILYNPKTGKREEVEVGSSRSRSLFEQGFQYEKPGSLVSGAAVPVPAQSKNVPMSVDTGVEYGPPIPTPATRPSVLPPVQQQYNADLSVQSAAPDQLSLAGSSRPLALTEQPVPEPTPQVRRNPVQEFNMAITKMLTDAQKGIVGTGDQDLMAQRNQLIQARFGAQRDVTPEDLRVLSPAQQAALRSGDVRGLEAQMGGVQTALQSREAERAAGMDYIKTAYGIFDKISQQYLPIEIGGALVQYNPDTGEYDELYKEPAGVASDVLLTPNEAASLGVKYGTTRSQAAMMGISPAGEMTTMQQKSFTDVTNKFQADAILKVVEGANVGAAIADQVIADPENAANQLKSLYILVKGLDPNSAVREGEIGLAESTQSYLQRFNTALVRISEGRSVDPKTAIQLATATKELFDVWKQVGDRRINAYKSQAKGLNIGDFFDEYLGGFSTVTEPFSGTKIGELKQRATKMGADPSDIDQMIKEGATATEVQSILDQLEQTQSPKSKGSVSLKVTLPNGVTKQGGSASWRNNNPLNIKFGGFAQNYGASLGSAATDGGNFAAFPSESVGLQAARDLLKAKSYSNLPLEQAMRRWSGNGYGSDVAPVNLRNKTTGQMTDSELDALIQAMRKREGYTIGRIIA